MVRIELDLVPDAEPIRGRVRDAGGVDHAFVGWLELVEILERARISRPADGATSAPDYVRIRDEEQRR
jgi:hypothetical protein